MRAVIESGFDLIYLGTVLTLGFLMLRRGHTKQHRLFGLMAVVLGAGDAFHLIPRIAALCTTGMEEHSAALGMGKLITSITMTVFYLLLYYVWRLRYQVSGKQGLTAFVYILCILRVALCLCPENAWTSAAQPLSWGIYRNIPFLLLGVLIIVLFFRSSRETADYHFRWMWMTIVLSFAFYLPVILWAHRVPALGMLMIPKTCAYVWTILIGYWDMNNH